MKRIVIILLTIVLVSYSSIALSEEKKELTPEQQQQMMQQAMSSMLPFMGQMVKIMMQVQLEVLSEPNTAEKLAAYTKNYYDALIKKGFTKEESLKITINMGIPSLPSMQK